jgi:hypothetical protein
MYKEVGMAARPRPEPELRAEPMVAAPLAAEAWGISGQWSAMVAGSMAGLAAFIILTALGLAIGITTGSPLNAQETGIAAGIWWLLTLLASGIFGGWVVGRTARMDRVYNAAIFGTVTWVLGILVLLLLLSLGVGNVLGGVGGIVGQLMTQRPLQGGLLTGEQRVDIAGIATSTAWILFASLALGLGATILGAYLGRPAERRPSRPNMG